eukprot:768429-Hanusia_phi.AAC.16
MIHCRLTGRVFCSACAKYKVIRVRVDVDANWIVQIPLPEYEKFPHKSKNLAKVCIQAYEARQATVLLWSQLHGGLTIYRLFEYRMSLRSRQKRGIQQTVVEEEDDDAEPPYIALLRKIPFCGENIADKITDE